MDAKWTQMDPKWTQMDAKIDADGRKWTQADLLIGKRVGEVGKD